ncbi:hemicentin-1-like isoform X2 [Mya arenaria]|uniref:hemicentin-1-like isoform X2 n=1 Tax=Mya arenaria TaxID=6604 RepID=UPI0022E3A6AF|nr:hemicentin-1-like isoform X2 [Mya arenaria]
MNRMTLTCWCFLLIIKTYACQNITLTFDQLSIEENKTLTLTCSLKSTQAFVILNYKKRTGVPVDQNNYILFNNVNNNCTVLPQLDDNIEVLSACFCKNALTYTCVTKPLTRHTSGDSWLCIGADGAKSDIVYTSLIVPTQSATILEDIQAKIDTQEGDLVNLTCESYFSIPAANISWFLDNKTPAVYGDDKPISSAIKTTVSENTDRTYTTKSVLIFNPHKNEDGMSLYCNASNLDSRIATSRKLLLNVRYKPDTTILINNNESYIDYYMIRNSLTIQSLQCDVRGGNPHANLTWMCYDANQTHFNTLMGATSVIIWMAGTHGDSECTCTASHILGWSAEKRVSIHVLYPPSEPTCEVGTTTVSGGPVNITIFSNVTMECTSDAYPEQSTFVWTLPKGTDVVGNELFLLNFQMDNEGIYNLYIENTMTPSKGDKIDGRRNVSFFLRVHHPPKITNLKTTLKVLEGVNFNLSCDAEPGNPNYTFFSWTSSHQPQRNTTDQLLTINNISRTDAGVYICFARNIMHPTGFPIQTGSDKKNVTIDVQYPATLPMFYSFTCTNYSFVNGGSIKVILGESLRINCSAGGNPSPTYFWSEGIKSSQLYIANVSLNHASKYLCTANNTMNDSYGSSVSSSMTSSFYLGVLNPPQIADLNTTIEVLEGENFSVICYAEPGNPNVTSYSWSSENPERNTSDKYLIIHDISRTDEGRFTCSVKNMMYPTGCPPKIGSDVESVYVDVQYKASITRFAAQELSVYHGDKLVFACEVDSDPPANITILSPTGSSLKYVHGINQFQYIKTSSCLEDIGQFTCVSVNKHNRNQPDRSHVTVDVKCAPMYPTDYNPITTMTVRPGEKVVFKIEIFSNPPPTNITWTNSSSTMRMPETTTPNRVIINTTDDISSSLIITSVEPWDYGNYSVMVENEIGSMIETFLIVEDSK